MSLKPATLILAALMSTTALAALAVEPTWTGLADKAPVAAPVATGAAPVFSFGETTGRAPLGEPRRPTGLEGAAPVRAAGLPRAAGVPKAPTPVDESALRYYASQNDTARVAAEIRRIKALHANWEPPQDLFEGVRDTAEEQQLWALFAEGKLEEVRAAVTEIQERNPNWRPSPDFVTKFEQSEARLTLVEASKVSDHQQVIALAEARPSLLACTEMDVLWRVAEALVHTAQPDKAFELYRFVLTKCSNPQERLATVQKASALLSAPMTERLIGLGTRAGEKSTAFESIRLDMVRRRIGEAIANPGADLNAAEMKSFEQLVEQRRSTNDAMLLGWHRYAKKDFAGAAQWFKLGMSWEQHPKAVEGYALTLREQGQLAEAEKIAYENRKRDPLIEKLFVEILATELTKHPVGAVEPARLTRFEQVVEESRSVVGSQALGWYYYNRDAAQQANAWFKRSVAWEPIESNVLGLALSSNKLKDRAAFKAVIAEFGARFPAVDGLKKFDVVTKVAAAPARRNRASGGARGGSGGGGDSGSAQEAVALFKNGRYGDALAALDRRGGPAREDQGLGMIRGWSLYHLGQWDKAREHFAALDRRQSTRDTQYGMHYARERTLPPQFRAD